MKNEAIAQLQLPDLADTDSTLDCYSMEKAFMLATVLQHYFLTVGMILRWRLEKIEMDPAAGIFQRLASEKFAQSDYL